MIYSLGDRAVTSTFPFTFTVNPKFKFSFDKVVPAVRAHALKRRRPLWDVDGGPTEGKKKRRLRLNLITSRLSRPFSSPASNIVNRGISRIAVWAKGRRLDKNLLRKAAIMNRLRARLVEAKTTEFRYQESTRQAAFSFRQVIVQRPRIYEMPLRRSPLSHSYYDEFDEEDEMLGNDEDGDGTPGERQLYSDFNDMDPMMVMDGDEYEFLDEVDGIPPEMAAEERAAPSPDDRMVEILKETERQRERLPPEADERLLEMRREKERQKEVCFVHFVA